MGYLPCKPAPGVLASLPATSPTTLQLCSVVLQRFHNVIEPDPLDFANKKFTFGVLPYLFGGGCCVLTGTNFMVRAAALFAVARRRPDATGSLQTEGPGRFQLFHEDQESEDVELGTRLHAAGYRSAFISTNLATGEVRSAGTCL